MHAIRWTYRNSCCVSMLACCSKIDGGGLVGDPISAPLASPAQWIHTHSTICALYFWFFLFLTKTEPCKNWLWLIPLLLLVGSGEKAHWVSFRHAHNLGRDLTKKEANRREKCKDGGFVSKNLIPQLTARTTCPFLLVTSINIPTPCADVYAISH